MPNIASSTNFPQGFAGGVSVRGVPLLQSQPGQVFFVGNSSVLLPNQRAGSDGNRGTFLDPFATLSYAVNTACVQGRGDIVFVMANHKETIPDAATLTLSTAGVAIIGLGSGNSRPTFTFTTATTANIPVKAANMSIQNCLFVGNFLSIASCMTGICGTSATSTISTAGVLTTVGAVTGTFNPGAALMGTLVPPGTIIQSQLTGTTGGIGTYQVYPSPTVAVTSTTITSGPQDFAIDNCEFRDISTVLGFLSVFTDGAQTNGSSGFQFTRNFIASKSTVSPTVAITLGVGHNRVNISDNSGVSAITAVTQGPCLLAAAADLTDFILARNRFYRPNTSTSLPVGVSAATTAWSGYAYDNYFWNLGASTGIWITTGTKLGFQNNYSPITGAADKNGLINPAAV
jgi:hypothetical protein